MRRGKFAVALLGAALTMLLAWATAVGAAQTHVFETGVGGGSLSFPGGLAVDDTGNLYVANAGGESLLRFDPSGAPAEFSATGSNAITGIAFDGSASQVAVAEGGPNAGDFYVTNSFGGGVQAFAPNGEPAPFSASASYISGNTIGGTPSEGFSEACGVAVDANGAIYVGDYGGFVDVYAPSGEFLTQAATPSPCAVAVDSAGNVYANEFNGFVRTYSPSAFPVTGTVTYGGETVVFEGAAFGIAVDPANDQLYVNEGTRLTQYESLAAGSAPIVSFGAGVLGEESRGVAVDRSGGVNDGSVYASRAADVARFGPLVTVPDATTLPADGVGLGTATLHGTVDPNGIAVTGCSFEFGPAETYGSSVPCAQTPAQIGAGEEPVAVDAALSGLSPGLYHYRLAIESASGPVRGADVTVSVPGPPQGPPPPANCPNAALRALQPAAQLPDCRAYELVSPPDKNGTDVKSNNSVQAALGGGAAVFSSLGGFADSPSATVLSYYRAQRGNDGWTTRGISPPAVAQGSTILSTSMMDLSSDLARMVMRAFPAPPTAPGGQPRAYDFFRREIPDGPFLNLTPEVPSPAELEGAAFYAGANEAMSTIGLTSAQQLSADGPAGGVPQAYVWENGELHYIGVLPGTGPAAASLVGGLNGHELNNAVSEDGSQVVFTARSPGSEFGLYLRRGLSETIEASASQRVPPEPTPRFAEFQGASASGDRVFFLSAEELLNSDTDSGNDLYVFEPGSGALRRLSVDADAGDGEEANVVQVLGMGEDGHRLYFAAQSRLVPGQPQTLGTHLYAWRDSGGPAGTLSYVATLDSVDEAVWSEQVSRRHRRVQVSANGRYLLFTAATRLGSFDNAGHTELYRYDSETGSRDCVSCDPAGTPAQGDASMFGLAGPAVSGIDYAGFAPRNVTDGGRVFFQTPDSLVLGDANGQEDVYIWEDGRPALVSTGQSPIGSQFGDASASGDDAFFLTGERLVATDTDNNVDLYDARVGGGLAAQNAAPAPGCEGEGCRGPAPAGPPAAAPGSGAVAGPGNARPRRHHRKRCHRHKKKRHAKHCHAGKHRKAAGKRDAARREGSAS